MMPSSGRVRRQQRRPSQCSPHGKLHLSLPHAALAPLQLQRGGWVPAREGADDSHPLAKARLQAGRGAGRVVSGEGARLVLEAGWLPVRGRSVSMMEDQAQECPAQLLG